MNRLWKDLVADQNQFEKVELRLHALQRLDAAVCALKTQNQFAPALSRLEADPVSNPVLPLVAAAPMNGWAQRMLLMEEEAM